MAKKSRRAKAKQRARMAKAVEQRQPQQPTQQPTQQPMSMPTKLQSPARVSPKAQASRVQDLASRYQYVLPDVKRIGIIAGSLIVFLIILSFALG
jgi:hypothetical protein